MLLASAGDTHTSILSLLQALGGLTDQILDTKQQMEIRRASWKWKPSVCHCSSPLRKNGLRQSDRAKARENLFLESTKCAAPNYSKIDDNDKFVVDDPKLDTNSLFQAADVKFHHCLRQEAAFNTPMKRPVFVVLKLMNFGDG